MVAPSGRGRQSKPEAAACGIGFLASRKGVAERPLVDIALGLCRQFDHRGAPGHGAGLLLDIPWPLLLDRFPEHTRAIAQRDVALGHVLPALRRRPGAGTAWRRSRSWPPWPGRTCWAGRTCPSTSRPCPRARPPAAPRPWCARPSSAGRHGLGEDGWFACRYLLRLALDETLSEAVGDDFAICQPLEPHGGLPRPRRAVADRRALPRPARRALRLALRALPQPLLAPTPPPPGGARSRSGRSPTTARSRPSAATWPGCTRSARTCVRKLVDRHPRPAADRRARALDRLRRRLRQREPRRHADRARWRAGSVAAAVAPRPPARGAVPRSSASPRSPRSTRRWACCSGPATVRRPSWPATATRRWPTSTATACARSGSRPPATTRWRRAS